MAHERIWCDTADPTWHVADPSDAVQAPDSKPGIYVQWHELGGVSLGTGDLNVEYIDNYADLPANSVNLRDFLPEPHDSDTARAYENLDKAIREAVLHAYNAGVAVPRHVWLDRQNCNHVVRVVRRGRNTSFGADE